MIYADNAATTRLSPGALEAMMPFLSEEYGNPSSLYAFGQRAKEALEEARQEIAGCLGCDAREIYFTSGGSEGDNQAILTAARQGERKNRRHIISTAFEHHAVLHTLEALKKQGFDITLLDVHGNGIIHPEQVAEAIREDTCLVTVMYANNEIGTIQPVAEIARICRERKVPFHTDAVQAAGHVPISLHAQGMDMLSLSAHKFHGPRGIGTLYVRRGLLPEPLIYGGAQERGRRAGTENVAAAVGMARALTEACEGMEENTKKIRALRDSIIRGLEEIPYGELNGDRVCRLPGNVSFCFEGIEGESLLLYLDDLGICASSGSACTSGSLEPSHVLLSIGRPHEVAHGSLRLTLSEDNTPREAEEIIRGVKETVERLRSMSPFWRDLRTGRRKHVFAERKEAEG